LQSSKYRYSRLESSWILAGRLVKLLPLTFNILNEVKQLKSPGIDSSCRLQLLKSNAIKEHNPENEFNDKLKEFVLFSRNEDKNIIRVLSSCPLHPRRDSFLSFLTREKEDGGCLLIAVPLISSSSKLSA
jgi:hypothetical protein